MDCPRCTTFLTSKDTPFGVVVDYCSSCKGIWLDHGELSYFAKEKSVLEPYFSEGLLDAKKSSLACPFCRGVMQEGGLIDADLRIDACQDCQGLWFDADELKKFRRLTATAKPLPAKEQPDEIEEKAELKEPARDQTVQRSSTGMHYLMQGGSFPSVEVLLTKEHSVFTESGGMSWMRGNVKMDTGTKGGILKGVGRMLSGESFFLTTYSVASGKAMVTFASEYPGTILARDLSTCSRGLIIQKDAFLAGETTVSLSVHFQKRLMAGLFGGEGFFLQRASGRGTVFLEITGRLVEYDLKIGERIKVDPGHVAAFEESVAFDMEFVKGIKNIFFSGEGLFLASLRGPGKVWLQTMTMQGLAAKIKRYLPAPSGASRSNRSAGGTIGNALINGIFNN